MHVSWVVLSRLSFDIGRRLAASEYFKIDRNPGFLKPIGISANRAYRPWLISPNVEVWQEIERKINKETKSKARGKSSVLRLQDFEGSPESSYGFTVRLYRPNIICVEVKCLDDLFTDLYDSFPIRNIEGHPAAKLVLDIILGIIASGDTKEYLTGNSYFAKPSFIFPINVNKDAFQEWRSANKKVIIGLLINNADYDLADEILSDKIIERNKDVDIKYEKAALSLVSKQGILTAYSIVSPSFDRKIRREHEKRTRFLEFALALQEFMRGFVDFRADNENTADFLLYLVLPYIGENTYLAKSVTGSYTWAILAAEIGLAKMIEQIPAAIIEHVGKKEHLFLQMPHEKYDDIDYQSAVRASTRWYTKKWIAADFAGSKILPWILTTLFAFSTLILAVMKMKG